MFVKFENVDYTYDIKSKNPIKALSNINMQIKAGEFICITGPTGSGKTTLMQHINGLLRPTSGRVIINDADISYNHKELQKLRLKIGLLFQFPEDQLFEETVYKDIAFVISKLKSYSDEAIYLKVKQVMNMVGLPFAEFKDISPMKLSGGEKRRVALAGIIVTEPILLILDEPMVGLDVYGRADMINIIKKFHANGKNTVIMITHELDLIAEFANRVIIVDKGRIVADGQPHKILGKVKFLEKLNLDAPEASYIANRLITNGWDIPETVVSWKDLEDNIINLWNRGREL